MPQELANPPHEERVGFVNVYSRMHGCLWEMVNSRDMFLTLLNDFGKRREYLATSPSTYSQKWFIVTLSSGLWHSSQHYSKEFRTRSWLRCYHCAMVRPLTQSVLFGSPCTCDHCQQHKLQIHRLCSVYDQCTHTKCKCLSKQSPSDVAELSNFKVPRYPSAVHSERKHPPAIIYKERSAPLPKNISTQQTSTPPHTRY